MPAPAKKPAEPPATDDFVVTHDVAAVSNLTAEQVAALATLREPTRDSEVGYKPQVWCSACSEARKSTRGAKIACDHHGVVNPCPKCGNKLTIAHVDLRYMGHAATTRRLVLADPAWSWEPVSTRDDGTPNPTDGGMWIRLTVAGVTRLGFGDAQGKTGPNAMKEIIGDAIRNAAMRFGCGVDLWHKGEFEDERELSNRRSEQSEPEAVAAAQDADAEAPQAAPDQPSAPPADDATAGRAMDRDALRARILSCDRIVQLERLRPYVDRCADEVTANADGVETRFRDLFIEQRDKIRNQP